MACLAEGRFLLVFLCNYIYFFLFPKGIWKTMIYFFQGIVHGFTCNNEWMNEWMNEWITLVLIGVENEKGMIDR